jgi:hypothetical protein
MHNSPTQLLPKKDTIGRSHSITTFQAYQKSDVTQTSSELEGFEAGQDSGIGIKLG